MSLKLTKVRRRIVRLADRLPAPRNEAARALLRDARDLWLGRSPASVQSRQKKKKHNKKARAGTPIPSTPQLWARPGSYSSPIVDPAEVRPPGTDVAAPVDLPGIVLDLAHHQKIWNDWRPHLERWAAGEAAGGRRYQPDNSMFGPGSARLFAGAIGAIRPARYIEIGSGFSSEVVLDLVDETRPEDPVSCTFVEPYPERLESILRPSDHERCRILVQKIQDVDLSVFDELEAGDVLMIDSSHVAKSGSDLLTELFAILPRLASGVFIHFHDILYPFDYPRNWTVEQNRSWNEVYFLRAFLMYNTAFEVHFWTDYFGLFGDEGDRGEWAVRGRSSSIWLVRR